MLCNRPDALQQVGDVLRFVIVQAEQGNGPTDRGLGNVVLIDNCGAKTGDAFFIFLTVKDVPGFSALVDLPGQCLRVGCGKARDRGQVQSVQSGFKFVFRQCRQIGLADTAGMQRHKGANGRGHAHVSMIVQN